MDEVPESQEQDPGGSENEGKAINDPLTRSEQEAPRAEFEGRTPE